MSAPALAVTLLVSLGVGSIVLVTVVRPIAVLTSDTSGGTQHAYHNTPLSHLLPPFPSFISTSLTFFLALPFFALFLAATLHWFDLPVATASAGAAVAFAGWLAITVAVLVRGRPSPTTPNHPHHLTDLPTTPSTTLSSPSPRNSRSSFLGRLARFPRPDSLPVFVTSAVVGLSLAIVALVLGDASPATIFTTLALTLPAIASATSAGTLLPLFVIAEETATRWGFDFLAGESFLRPAGTAPPPVLALLAVAHRSLALLRLLGTLVGPLAAVDAYIAAGASVSDTDAPYSFSLLPAATPPALATILRLGFLIIPLTDPAAFIELMLNSPLYSTLAHFSWAEFNKRSAVGASLLQLDPPTQSELEVVLLLAFGSFSMYVSATLLAGLLAVLPAPLLTDPSSPWLVNFGTVAIALTLAEAVPFLAAVASVLYDLSEEREMLDLAHLSAVESRDMVNWTFAVLGKIYDCREEDAIAEIEGLLAQGEPFASNHRARFYLAVAYSMVERDEDALRQYERVCELRPTWGDAWGERAVSLAKGRSGPEAEDVLARAAEYLDRAARLAPSLPNLHFNRGVIAGKRGRRAEAKAAYEAQLRATPGDARSLANLSHLLGESSDEADLRKSCELAEAALASDPSDGIAMLTLAVMYVRLGDEDAARGWELRLATLPLTTGAAGVENARAKAALLANLTSRPSLGEGGSVDVEELAVQLIRFVLQLEARGGAGRGSGDGAEKEETEEKEADEKASTWTTDGKVASVPTRLLAKAAPLLPGTGPVGLVRLLAARKADALAEVGPALVAGVGNRPSSYCLSVGTALGIADRDADAMDLLRRGLGLSGDGVGDGADDEAPAVWDDDRFKAAITLAQSALAVGDTDLVGRVATQLRPALDAHLAAGGPTLPFDALLVRFKCARWAYEGGQADAASLLAAASCAGSSPVHLTEAAGVLDRAGALSWPALVDAGEAGVRAAVASAAGDGGDAVDEAAIAQPWAEQLSLVAHMGSPTPADWASLSGEPTTALGRALVGLRAEGLLHTDSASLYRLDPAAIVDADAKVGAWLWLARGDVAALEKVEPEPLSTALLACTTDEAPACVRAALTSAFSCDVCESPIEGGVRVHCTDCDDYDMCEGCRDSHDKDHHLVEVPVGVPVLAQALAALLPRMPPTSLEFFHRAGLYHAQVTKDWAAAELAFRALARANETDAGSHFLWGRAQAMCNDVAGAKETLARAHDFAVAAGDDGLAAQIAQMQQLLEPTE